jgi:aspartyl protease family protein
MAAEQNPLILPKSAVAHRQQPAQTQQPAQSEEESADTPSVADTPSENRSEGSAESEPTVRAEAARTVEIRAGSHGHFVAKAEIENTPVSVLIDTGATKVALSYEDAERIGLHPFSLTYDTPVYTANGLAKAASVTLSRVELDNVVVRDVEAVVMPQGVLQDSLLGMSFLSRLSVFRISDDTLYLEE